MIPDKKIAQIEKIIYTHLFVSYELSSEISKKIAKEIQQKLIDTLNISMPEPRRNEADW